MWRNLLSSLRDFGINRGNVSGDCRHRHRAIVPAGTKSHLLNRYQYVMKLLPKILHGVAHSFLKHAFEGCKIFATVTLTRCRNSRDWL